MDRENGNCLIITNENSDKEINVVIGISLYKKGENNLPHSVLSWFIQNETLITALQYISFANFGMAYMGVGRNLAYKKSVFLGNNDKNSFEKIAAQIGGDDDLIFSEKHFYKNAAICLEGQTESKAPQNFKEWFNQKKRHLSVGKKYSFRQKIISSIYPLSIFLWYISVFGFLINGFYEVLGFELLRQLLFFVILRIFLSQIKGNSISSHFYYKNFYTNFLNNFFREFFITFFCFEFVFICYYSTIGISTIFCPPKKWK